MDLKRELINYKIDFDDVVKLTEYRDKLNLYINNMTITPKKNVVNITNEIYLYLNLLFTKYLSKLICSYADINSYGILNIFNCEEIAGKFRVVADKMINTFNSKIRIYDFYNGFLCNTINFSDKYKYLEIVTFNEKWIIVYAPIEFIIVVVDRSNNNTTRSINFVGINYILLADDDLCMMHLSKKNKEITYNKINLLSFDIIEAINIKHNLNVDDYDRILMKNYNVYIINVYTYYLHIRTFELKTQRSYEKRIKIPNTIIGRLHKRIQFYETCDKWNKNIWIKINNNNELFLLGTESWVIPAGFFKHEDRQSINSVIIKINLVNLDVNTYPIPSHISGLGDNSDKFIVYSTTKIVELIAEI
jgi:hypothetical protein